MRKQVNASAAMGVISAAYVSQKEEQFEDLMWNFMASRVGFDVELYGVQGRDLRGFCGWSWSVLC